MWQHPSVKRTRQTSTHNFFKTTKTPKQVASDRAVTELNILQARMISYANLPDRFIENKHYRRVVRYAIDNASSLKDYEHMGKRKLHTIQAKTFDDFKLKVKTKVDEIRQYYIDLTGEQQPFIIVGQGVWESKKKDINGLTIFFTDPRTMETFRIAVALTHAHSKTAIYLAEESLLGLERYDITMKDLRRPVNDNCNTAKKTGRL